jgi:DNA gyrase subunit A
VEIKEGKVIQVDIENEMRKSYMDFAMSVIVGRALPDVRDGLKPVHRRILYAMYEQKMTPDAPYKKSARIVGEVIGKYHPHGESAIYDTMVRLAQDFSTRYLLVDGHGNFGSVDGDPPAAMRYTEARLSRLAMELLRDIEKDTVDFMPNYDESTQEPKVLPARFPNLLVNGSSGIAVGMATNIPPHNLVEIINGLFMLIDNPDVELKELMTVIKGPDFPTGGLILGREGIRSAYSTGRGRIKMRARVHTETTKGDRMRLVVTELPYMVNKSSLIERIADLVKEKKIDGITGLRDESDRRGMRIVMELRRDANPQVVLNQLYSHTQLQETFGAIMLVLVDDEPRILNLKELLRYYLEHQKEIIIRRTKFELAEAEKRAHILEGFRIALANIDEVIRIVRSSRSPKEAEGRLMERFQLSQAQAQAILAMTIQRLTGLEQEKIEQEYQELLKAIAYYKEILASEALVYKIIKEDLQKIKDRYGDKRRTEITYSAEKLEIEDLIAEEDIVVTITHKGFIKRLPADTYKSQRRGGRGIAATTVREEDFVEHLFITSTHDNILFFSNRGRAYVLKGFEIPEASRQARGQHITGLLPFEQGEVVTAIIAVRTFDPDKYIIMATRDGTIKKCQLEDFSTCRKSGLNAIQLVDDDELIGVKLTTGKDEVILISQMGQSIRFQETDVRSMGRNAMGVRGMNLEDGDVVVAMDIIRDGDVLVVTENGFGKRTPISEYRSQYRGGKGVKTLNITDKNGVLVGARIVAPSDELMLLSANGTLIRLQVDEISIQGRTTTGVILMKLDEGDKVVALAKVEKEDEL